MLIHLCHFQDVQQTQPIFEEDDGQKQYEPFEQDPMQKHAEDVEKDLIVQKSVSPDVPAKSPALELQTEEAVDSTTEAAGFWKKFGSKAKGIFG